MSVSPCCRRRGDDAPHRRSRRRPARAHGGGRRGIRRGRRGGDRRARPLRDRALGGLDSARAVRPPGHRALRVVRRLGAHPRVLGRRARRATRRRGEQLPDGARGALRPRADPCLAGAPHPGRRGPADRRGRLRAHAADPLRDASRSPASRGRRALRPGAAGHGRTGTPPRSSRGCMRCAKRSAGSWPNPSPRSRCGASPSRRSC